MTIEIQGPLLGQSHLCEPILRALPDWFGIEEATRQYVADTAVLPTFLATVNDQPVGFLTLKQHTPYAAEIHVMAVLLEWHRHGVGRTLLAASEAYLQAQNVEFLQVKTLSPQHPDVGYGRTRHFYLALGFRPLEEFPNLWGEANPCLQLIKYLG
ncbi:MAG: GNAT family N-acetyltransferase [Anaerolineaceae bacterium]|nr:GNAT family N-acetyltransferase [Anaerolineaceae bacterium]